MTKDMELLMHIANKCRWNDVTITISEDGIELRKAGKIRPYVIEIPAFMFSKTSMSLKSLIDTAIMELVSKETEDEANERN